MKRHIRMYLGDRVEPIGEIRYDQQGKRERSAFAYTTSWLGDSESFLLDPALPLVDGFQFRAQKKASPLFHGAIADSEPDGWARRVILRDHAKRRQAARAEGKNVGSPELGELDFLLAVDDESRIGALRYQDESGIFQGAVHVGARRTPPLIELRQLLASSQSVETNTETMADLAYLRGRGTSLGGLRPKCSVRDDDGHLAIAKFPSVSDERAVTKGEVLALTLAAHAGIRVAESRIVLSEDLPVAVIRRFDRTASGARIPYVSAATLLGAERDDPEEYAYTDIVDALRMYGRDAQADINELFRRIAFSICINDVDDHLHNHGFLHVAHGQWRLSPAFDINPFPGRAHELKAWISEELGPEASLVALRSVVPYFRIQATHADAIICEVRAAVSTWKRVGTEIGMTSKELDSFSEAFEENL